MSMKEWDRKGSRQPKENRRLTIFPHCAIILRNEDHPRNKKLYGKAAEPRAHARKLRRRSSGASGNFQKGRRAGERDRRGRHRIYLRTPSAESARAGTVTQAFEHVSRE